MDTIRFKVGDEVFAALVHWTAAPKTCPDCLGRKTWAVALPNGEAWDVDCPRCHPGGYSARSTGVVREDHDWRAEVVRGVVNGVRFDSTREAGRQVEYTFEGFYVLGVGGTVRYAGEVFATREEALADAARRAAEQRAARDEEEAKRARRKRKPKGAPDGDPEGDHDALRSVAYARSQVRAAEREIARWTDYAALHGAVIARKAVGA